MTSREPVFQAVTARRLQWDNLVWQVPILSLTAQAFLFTIALGADTTQVARTFACLLSLIVTFLCVTLMARHRQAEISDADWIREYEEQAWPDDEAVHGDAFRRRRNLRKVDGGWTDRVVPILPGYITWIAGLLLFGLAALAILAITWIWPDLLTATH